MPITIDEESGQRVRLSTDIDNWAQRYKTLNATYSFTSPALWTLEKNYFFLLRNSVQKTFESKYKMRPDFMSYDEYGTVAMAHVLLYMNGIYSIEDFDLNMVVVPTYNAIMHILQDKFSKQNVDDLEEVDW